MTLQADIKGAEKAEEKTIKIKFEPKKKTNRNKQTNSKDPKTGLLQKYSYHCHSAFANT